MAIDVSRLKRNPERAKKAVKVVGGKLVATEDVTIYIPRYLASGKLGSITDVVRAVGFHCLVASDGSYAVDSTCGVMSFQPTNMTIDKHEEEDYLVLKYKKDEVICDTIKIVKSRTLMYEIFNVFLGRGKHPFYFNIIDRARFDDTAIRHTGVSLEADRAILELMTSMCIRNPEDISTHNRYSYKTAKDLMEGDYIVIPQRSVSLGVGDAIGKLTGSYSRSGSTGALANPTEYAERLDELLTS